MKKTLLLGLALLGVNATNFAQTTLFEDSFETYSDFAITGVGGWTLTDLDLLSTYGVTLSGVNVTFPNSGVAMSYIVMNSTMTTPTLGANWAGHTGPKCMAAMAGIPAGIVGSNNDYLISPQIQLGTSGNTLKFWAKAISATYPETFKVGISTTGTAPANFTFITPAAGVTPTTSWVEYTYDINAYQGQNVYIAIQCISSDAFALLVDDFKVTATAVASTQSFFANNFSIYPNPANNVLNLSVKNGLSVNEITMVDINGRTVKTINNSFNSEMEINVSDLTSGVYMLNVNTDEGVATSKFVKN